MMDFTAVFQDWPRKQHHAEDSSASQDNSLVRYYEEVLIAEHSVSCLPLL